MAVAALCMAVSPLPFTAYFYNMDNVKKNHTRFLCDLHKVRDSVCITLLLRLTPQICMEMLPSFFNSIITFLTLFIGVQRSLLFARRHFLSLSLSQSSLLLQVI